MATLPLTKEERELLKELEDYRTSTERINVVWKLLKNIWNNKKEEK